MSKLIPFGKFLEANNCSLLVSTYKSNLMLAVSSSAGEVTTSAWPMPRPMGIARLDNRLAIGTESVIVQYTNQPELASFIDGDNSADAVYLKRSLHVTGDINIHDVRYAKGDSGEAELWFVNTRFSCLATIKEGYSFIPRWNPDWISTLISEDRCHLNGMEVVAGLPRYVSSFSQTDTSQGWKSEDDVPKDTGVIVDIRDGSVVAEGIFHPHSPTWYRDTLYVLESGTGNLCHINVQTGKVNRITALTGYVRGLAFINGFAVIGLSKIRESNSSKVDLEQPDEAKAGLAVVDLSTGEIVSTLRFDEAVSEIYDLEILEGVKKPIFAEHNQTTANNYVLPAELRAAFIAS